MKVVVARTIPAAGLDRLEERFDVESGGIPLDRAWLPEHAPGASAIVTDPTVAVDEERLERAGQSRRGGRPAGRPGAGGVAVGAPPMRDA